MIGGIFEGAVALFLGTIGGIYVIGQLKSNAERNAADIDAIKTMMHEYQEDMKDLISKNLKDVKDLIDANKENQRDALNREITHIKDMIAMTSSETREDIKRLEIRQDQANHLREKYAILAQSVKSLHRRLDIEPPALLDDEDD
jgi:chromosome segregation ATPase